MSAALVLDGSGRPVAANRAALELLGAAGLPELEAGWGRLRAAFGDLSAGTLQLPHGAGEREFEADCINWKHAGSSFRLVCFQPGHLPPWFESELRRASRMRALNRLHRVTAHEAKAPLNAINLNLEVLRQSIQEHENDLPASVQLEWEKTLETVGFELARVQRFLERALHQTRPAQRAAAYFELSTVLEHLIELLQPTAAATRVQLCLRSEEDGLLVHGHRDELEQALLNVLLNALEASPPGGRLDVVVAGGGGFARIAIEDEGPGIEPDRLQRVFSLDASWSKGGAGIGLHVARGIARQFGGDVALANRPEGGLRVEVRLPLETR